MATYSSSVNPIPASGLTPSSPAVSVLDVASVLTWFDEPSGDVLRLIALALAPALAAAPATPVAPAGDV